MMEGKESEAELARWTVLKGGRGEVRWLTPVIPARLEAEMGGSPKVWS